MSFVQVCSKCKTRPAALSATYHGRPAALCLDCYEAVYGPRIGSMKERKNEAARIKYWSDPEYRQTVIEKVIRHQEKQKGMA